MHTEQSLMTVQPICSEFLNPVNGHFSADIYIHVPDQVQRESFSFENKQKFLLFFSYSKQKQKYFGIIIVKWISFSALIPALSKVDDCYFLES